MVNALSMLSDDRSLIPHTTSSSCNDNLITSSLLGEVVDGVSFWWSDQHSRLEDKHIPDPP
jgi:hypothetical protein